MKDLPPRVGQLELRVVQLPRLPDRSVDNCLITPAERCLAATSLQHQSVPLSQRQPDQQVVTYGQPRVRVMARALAGGNRVGAGDAT